MVIQSNKGNSTKGIAFFVFILSIKGPPINNPKIENDPKEPKIIKTIWGKGYMFVAAG